MSYSVVRWQQYPDVWEYEQDIKKSVDNPYGRTTSSYSLATWDTTEDTWGMETFIFPMKHLLRSNGDIYTVGSNNEFTQLTGVTQPSRRDYQDYGLDNLEGIMTPRHTSNKMLDRERREGEGKVFSVSIEPSKHMNSIKSMKVQKVEKE